MYRVEKRREPKTQRCVYELTGDTLKVAYQLEEKAVIPPESLSPRPEVVVLTLERVKPSPSTSQ